METKQRVTFRRVRCVVMLAGVGRLFSTNILETWECVSNIPSLELCYTVGA